MPNTEVRTATIFDFAGVTIATTFDHIDCPQCGYENAEYETSRATEEFIWEHTTCTKCGYTESREPQCDQTGKHCGWKHDVEEGVGAFHYHFVDSCAFCVECLHTAAEFAEAKDCLRKGLENGKIDAASSCLTKWNGDTKQVELVIGEFPEAGDVSWDA